MLRSENLLAAATMMASMACFILNDTALKTMAGDVPLYQLLVLRGVMTSALVGALAWRMGALNARPPARDMALIGLRTLAELGATFFFLTALFNMPIANLMAIHQALPLTITLGAALIYGEKVGWRRLSAIAIGFCGVLLIIRPWTSGFTLWSVYALLAVFCVTVRDLTTRRLSSGTPSILVTLVASVSVMLVFGLIQSGEPFVPMAPHQIGLTVFAAFCIIGGYLFSIVVMRIGEVSFAAPFRYSSMLWALALGWVVFGDWPDALTLLGAAIVVGSGLFMLYREARLVRRLARQTP
ncbi:MAG: DMT family transporter [Pseudomonadota bacterium]